MAGVNKVILVGNLGKDPEIKYLDGNIARVHFSLATSETYKDKAGNRVEQTEWHNIVIWRALAESAEKFLKKGMQVYIEGKIQTRQWNDKDGAKRSITEINCESYVILQRKDGASADIKGFDSNTNLENLDSAGLPY
ncbi:MAG: single-stranded DNA-binding protein [Bacteroidota bacterium]|nr:single-stranded DNA-binding protein [Bacteroidota bacterium]MDP3143846.1 single-stranded DNA-binding protein [Bacteroidota bacterium]